MIKTYGSLLDFVMLVLLIFLNMSFVITSFIILSKYSRLAVNRHPCWIIVILFL